MHSVTNLSRWVTTAARFSQRDVLPSVNVPAIIFINTQNGYTCRWEPNMAISNWFKKTNCLPQWYCNYRWIDVVKKKKKKKACFLSPPISYFWRQVYTIMMEMISFLGCCRIFSVWDKSRRFGLDYHPEILNTFRVRNPECAEVLDRSFTSSDRSQRNWGVCDWKPR